jgi:hypothetical protein
MNGKLNMYNRISIPVMVDDQLDNIEGLVTDYPDVDLVFAIDTDISRHGVVPDWIQGCSRPYKTTWTPGPSKYTPHGWQIPLLFAIAESTGEYTFLCNPRDQLDPELISTMFSLIGEHAAVVLCDYDYNEAMRDSILNGTPMKWLNTPMLFKKDIFYRQMAYFVGQIYYYRYMQTRLWCETDFVCLPQNRAYLPIESIDRKDIHRHMVEDYSEEDILPGGKYCFEYGKYDMEDTSKVLCNRCGVLYNGVSALEFLRDINYV